MTDKLARLKELSYIIAEGPDAMRREFTMRVPAEPDRDADLVIMWAHNEITALRAENAELRKDAAIGAVVWHFIDRMNDVCEKYDPANKILAEFVTAVMPAIDAAIDAEKEKMK